MINSMECPFCGKMLMLLDAIQDDADIIEKKEAAARSCNCRDSQAILYAMNQITEGEFNVEQMCAENPRIVGTLKPVVRYIRYGIIKNLTIKFENNDEDIKVTMGLTKDGNVKITQSKTIKEVRE